VWVCCIVFSSLVILHHLSLPEGVRPLNPRVRDGRAEMVTAFEHSQSWRRNESDRPDVKSTFSARDFSRREHASGLHVSQFDVSAPNQGPLLVRGPERSGTNIMHTLLQRNFGKHVTAYLPNVTHSHARLTYGQSGVPSWKHFRIYTDHYSGKEADGSLDTRGRPHKLKRTFNISIRRPADLDRIYNLSLVYLVPVKAPYAWIRSICSWHHNCNSRSKTTRGSMLGVYARDWSAYYGRWLELIAAEPSKAMIVRYEDLLQDSAAVMRHVHSLVPQLQRTGEWATMDDSVRINMSRGASFSRKRAYYLDRKYLASFKKSELKEVNRELNSTVMDALNYTFHET